MRSITNAEHLPDNSLKMLLNIFNNIWETFKFPKEWTYLYSTIIPIHKPGKDPADRTIFHLVG